MNAKKQKEIIRYTPSVDQGLSTEQVLDRKKDNLVNFVKQKYSKSYLSIIAGNLCTFFNLLGLIVTIALLYVEAELSQFFFVMIYLANIGIGIIQEIRAKICIEKLTLISAKSTKVIRNGEICEIASKEIVLDDIIMLGLGCQIPTDSIIIDGEIEVNESLLTGESIPVKKHANDQILAGSFVTSGTCYARAVSVGKQNYVEKLSAKAKKYKKPYSELMTSLRKIIKLIGFIIVPIATCYILKPILIEHSTSTLKEIIQGTSAVVIGMIPSGMFLLTSVALAVGIIKLSRHKTLVQDLYSLETLARVDTICFDKTGTITDGNMSVKEVINNDESINIKEIMSSMIGALNDSNQTAIALKNYFGDEKVHTATKTIPFNSKNKFSACTFEKVGTFSFGAPEFILTKEKYNQIKDKIEDYASKGLRVLVLANSSAPIIDDNIPNDFDITGLILLEDNIRKEAISTINWFKQNGVEIKVISGDNPITVSEVSKRVGIENADKYVSLDGLSDQEVYDLATKYTVFGRVSPEQKAILIKALNDNGHTTAMTGDGVNDILALKEANCAISVATGSEAARNISHLVLMDNNFNSLPKVVYEGRRVINNIQSSASLYLMKTLFVLTISVILLFLPFIHAYPFVTSHLIILEVLIIGVPSFCLSLQPNDEKVSGKFINHIIVKTIPSSLIMIFNELVIMACQGIFGTFSDEIYTTLGVYAITLAGAISLFFICRPLNIYRSIVFFGNLLFILLLFVLALFGFLLNMGFVIMPAFAISWPLYALLFGVLALDWPILIYSKKILQKLTKKRY